MYLSVVRRSAVQAQLPGPRLPSAAQAKAQAHLQTILTQAGGPGPRALQVHLLMESYLKRHSALAELAPAEQAPPAQVSFRQCSLTTDSRLVVAQMPLT